MLNTIWYDSPMGGLLLAEQAGALVGLWMEGQKYFLGDWADTPRREGATPTLDLARAWLDAYFAGQRPAIGQLPLAPRGGEFRQQVWQALCRIPYGQVTTYGQLARQLAAQLGRRSMSAQAVGGAVGHNPLSVIVPCHRVVGAGGSLTGYAGGVQKKLWLLKHEGAPVERLTLPTRGTAL